MNKCKSCGGTHYKTVDEKKYEISTSFDYCPDCWETIKDILEHAKDEVISSPIEPPNQITFCLGRKWIIRISQNGFEFNHDEFPEGTPADFAREFLLIVKEVIEKERQRRCKL